MTTDSEVANDLDSAYGKMKSMLPNQLVYATVGNHEASPVNSFPPDAVNTTISSQWVYGNLSSLWSSWIGSTAAAEADTNPGSYSVKHANSTLRIISINTNMYYKENFWLYEATMETDPSGQLAWLVDELQAAEDADERVYIIGHMPMGSGDVLHDGSNYFNQIVNRYQATIAALFFGKSSLFLSLQRCHN
jgi:sphingomyelin phosphodiesterase